MYGPTEATVDVTYYDCDLEKEPMLIPIGRPIDNTELYVLDQYQQVVPIGVAGTLPWRSRISTWLLQSTGFNY